MPRLLSLDDLAALPEEQFPFLVLSNGFTSAFGYLVSLETQSFWNHFMWYRRPGVFASQWFWFREFDLMSFNKHSLKLWHNPRWSRAQRATLCGFIDARLSMGKWRTRYDVLGIIGKLLHLDRVHTPWLDFCSETLKWLALIDPDCADFMRELPTPTPEDVNDFLKKPKTQDGSDRYVVFGRVQPE